MSTIETDQVLSAIRRGEDSLPKLRAATGLEYAQLHPILYKLEYDWRSISRSETADGFDRFTPTASEKTNGGNGTHWSAEQAIPPAAFQQTKFGNQARAASLIQRDAPYCVGCHGICLFVIEPDGLLQWKCRPCGVLFEGSSFQTAHIKPTPEPAMRERVLLGPEEEAAIENMRVRTDHPTIGDEEEAALAAMRGGELSEDEARIAEEIDREVAASVDSVLADPVEEIENWRSGMCRKCGAPAVSKTGNICATHQAIEDAVIAPCKRCDAPTTAKIRNRRLGHCAECYKDLMRERREQNKTARQAYVDTSKQICGCGRQLPHHGRCSARRNGSDKNIGGRPRIEVDLQKFEDLLADPRLTINQVCEGAGIKRNLIYDRKDIDPDFGAAYQRGMDRREAAIADGKLKTPEDVSEKPHESARVITETITSNGTGVAHFAPSNEDEKSAMAKVGIRGANDYRPRFLDDGRLMEHAAEDYRDTQRRAQEEIERLRNLVNLIDVCSRWCPPPALPPVKQMIDSLKAVDRELKRMEAYVEQEKAKAS